MKIRLGNLKPKYIFLFTFFTFIFFCLISISLTSIEECKCNEVDKVQKISNNKHVKYSHKNVNESIHRLAILVPFRDRFEELLTFVPHMSEFLNKQRLQYKIFILNQVDKYRFNRASLINVGFLYVKENFDYIAMHDVDLMPLNNDLLYSFPEKRPFHVSSPDVHPRYHYQTFVGGILLVKREHFIMVNGMSNKYWGWGLEDDEFYVRLKKAGLDVDRPRNLSTGIHNTFKHMHDRQYRKRDTIKCYNQREITRKRDRQTGLNNVSYKILNVINMTITGAQVAVINISLICDKASTPWCECNGENDQQTGKKTNSSNNSKNKNSK